MFWKAGLKITPVYKELGGSPLPHSRAGRLGAGRAGGLGPEWGQFPVPGPGAGTDSQFRVPRPPRFQN